MAGISSNSLSPPDHEFETDTSTSSNARMSAANAFALSWEQTVQPGWLRPASPEGLALAAEFRWDGIFADHGCHERLGGLLKFYHREAAQLTVRFFAHDGRSSTCA